MAPFWIMGREQPASAASETAAPSASFQMQWRDPDTDPTLAGRTLGQLDAGVVGVGSIEDDGMTH